MIISAIIIYLIGCFLAFLCLGAQNDINERQRDNMRWSSYLILAGYIVVLIFLLHNSINMLAKMPDNYISLKKFVKFFSKPKV